MSTPVLKIDPKQKAALDAGFAAAVQVQSQCNIRLRRLAEDAAGSHKSLL